MSFSSEWDESYKGGTHLSIWPWSDLVSYVMRYVKPQGNDFKVLELGCGAGANIPFFLALGVDYYGIEGSSAIVEQLHVRYPNLSEKIVIGDFTKALPFDMQFDLIVDRAALTHNNTDSIKQGLSLVWDRLKPDGKFVGIDWFSMQHSDYSAGLEAEDRHSRKNFSTGQFVGIGRVHFSDQSHLEELFRTFSIQVMEHKLITRAIPKQGHIFACWNFIVAKPGS
ncbi:MAG: class I SAM-dependent methyltransferase [Negativicutes bacterium]|nr:class I SAM-dependent methyltransferase [Negativicutes bacterium]